MMTFRISVPLQWIRTRGKVELLFRVILQILFTEEGKVVWKLVVEEHQPIKYRIVEEKWIQKLPAASSPAE